MRIASGFTQESTWRGGEGTPVGDVPEAADFLLQVRGRREAEDEGLAPGGRPMASTGGQPTGV